MLTSISQSMIKDFERCTERFRLLRVEGNYGFGSSAGLAAEAGTAFDAYCRHSLERQIDLDKELINRDGTALKKDAVEWGRFLYGKYEESGAFQFLRDQGIAYVGREKTVLLTEDRDAQGVKIPNPRSTPFAGIPDLNLCTGQIDDWKTTGVGSKAGKRAIKNYTRLWTPVGLIAGKMRWHCKKANPGVLLEDINEKWAFQLTCYNFLLGRRPGWSGMKGGIHAVFVKGREVEFAYYEGRISTLYQWQVWNTIHDVWGQVNNPTWPAPKYSKYKCNMWGRLCEVAQMCEAFQAREAVKGTWLEKMGKR